MREFPRTTNEVVDLDVTGPSGEVTAYKVLVQAAGLPAPAISAITADAEQDGTLWGPRINGLPAGLYEAWAKIGTRVRGPIRFRLTP